jgi:ketopantoate reductase
MLREKGVVVEDVVSRQRDAMQIAVTGSIEPSTSADLCLVTVRREQLEAVLPALGAADRIGRCVFMVNHANGSTRIVENLGADRVVLAFPGFAGGLDDDGTVRYLAVSQQPTTIASTAPDIALALRRAGLAVTLVRDMDGWLVRHAVFVTAMVGGIYACGGDATRLSSDAATVAEFILAVREGWQALDKSKIAPASLALRMIFYWVPLPFAVAYWRTLLASPRGEYYFARHARHAAIEMACLAGDIRARLCVDDLPHLQRLYAAIDRTAYGN